MVYILPESTQANPPTYNVSPRQVMKSQFLFILGLILLFVNIV